MCKRQIFIGVFIWFATGFMHAQSFNGGVLFGLNATQIDGDDLGGYNKAGFTAGVFVFNQLSERFKLQLEVKYSGKGSATPKDSPEFYKIRLDYAEVPVIASFRAAKHFYIDGGLSYGYLFRAEHFTGAWQDFDDGPKKSEVAFLGGVHYELMKHISVSARMGYSLFALTNAERKQVGTGFNNYYVGPWYNNVVTFSLYYNILENF